MKENEGFYIEKCRAYSPVARLFYPKLLEPKNNKQGEPKYTALFVFPIDTDMSVLDRIIREAAQDKWGDNIPPYLNDPIHDGNDKLAELSKKLAKQGLEVTDNHKLLYENNLYINSSSTRKPAVVKKIDGVMYPLTTPQDIYSGMYVRVSFNAFPYDSNGNQGVGLGMTSILKVRDGQQVAGSAGNPEKDFHNLPDTEEKESDLPITRHKRRVRENYFDSKPRRRNIYG